MLNLNQPDKKIESWDILSVLKKIENGNVAIAAYQRGKAWNTKAIEEYLEVILSNNISIIPSLEGSIRNEKKQDDLIAIDSNYPLNKKNVIAIVDGQQRLTHLYLGIKENSYFVNFKKIAYEIALTMKNNKEITSKELYLFDSSYKKEKFIKKNEIKNGCSLKIYIKEPKTSSILFKIFLENLNIEQKLIKLYLKYYETYQKEIINQKLNISIMDVSLETEKLCFRTSNTKGEKLTSFQIINSLSDGDTPFGYVIIRNFLDNISNNSDLDLFFKHFNLKDNFSLEKEKRIEYIYRNSPNMSLEKFCRAIIQSEKIERNEKNIIVSEKEILSRNIDSWTKNLSQYSYKYLESLNALKKMRLFENKSDSITLFISYFLSDKYNKIMKETSVKNGFKFFYASMAVQNTVFNFKNTGKLVTDLRNCFEKSKDSYGSSTNNMNHFKNLIKIYDYDVDYALTSKSKSKTAKILQEILIEHNKFYDITYTDISENYDIHHLIPEKCERNDLFEDTIINSIPLFSKKNKQISSANLKDYLSDLNKNNYIEYQIPYIEKKSKNFEKIFLEKRKELLKNFFCNYFNVNSKIKI
jgi:hypothetical protein